MKEAIDEVLAAEKQAQLVVAAARERAEATKRAADAEAAELLKQARGRAAAEVRAAVERAEKEAEEEAAARVASERAEGERWLARHRAQLDELAARLVELVVEPVYKRKR